MLKRFNRYPLVIDPSGQAVEFLLNQYKDKKITKTSFLDSSFMKNLESSLRFGNPLLVQDVESMDPVLNPVLNKRFARRVDVFSFVSETRMSISRHRLWFSSSPATPLLTSHRTCAVVWHSWTSQSHQAACTHNACTRCWRQSARYAQEAHGFVKAPRRIQGMSFSFSLPILESFILMFNSWWLYCNYTFAYSSLGQIKESGEVIAERSKSIRRKHPRQRPNYFDSRNPQEGSCRGHCEGGRNGSRYGRDIQNVI